MSGEGLPLDERGEQLHVVQGLLGAAFLTVSLLVNFNLASLVLEFFWAAIALWGLAKAWRAKGNAA